MIENKIVIAIDGFSSCGKSTLAKELAQKLKYNYIDSGAMYRAITLFFLRNKINISNSKKIQEAISNIKLSFMFNNATNQSEICLNNENVEVYIRDMHVSDMVSTVAAIKDVRYFAIEQQKQFGIKKGIVMDGRDIGTTVFPEAELKIFMTADPEVRILRRFKEMTAKNKEVTIDDVKKNIEHRDFIDTTRTESPLKCANDAIILNNSNLTKEEQFNKAYEMAINAIKQLQIQTIKL